MQQVVPCDDILLLMIACSSGWVATLVSGIMETPGFNTRVYTNAGSKLLLLLLLVLVVLAVGVEGQVLEGAHACE